MPELPEVEHLRRRLEPVLVGRTVEHVHVHRRDVIRPAKVVEDPLNGATISELRRHGKQLALVADDGRCMLAMLGMTGSLRVYDNGDAAAPLPDHTHVVWRLDDAGRLAFRDPRRFGRIVLLASLDALREHWSHLGPDALTVTPARLHARLARTRRSVKAALLDQHLIAGLGNIYVDELLHRVGVHPLQPACDVARPMCRRLVGTMRRLLHRAIDAGGSTIRDYTDSTGRAGAFQRRHHVYGRAGQPCRRCDATLAQNIVGGRTTVHCPRCQPAKS